MPLVSTDLGGAKVSQAHFLSRLEFAFGGEKPSDSKGHVTFGHWRQRQREAGGVSELSVP